MGSSPPAAGAGQTYYFAYGSMCNPVSLKRRGILPTYSTPAQLHGYRLEFGGANGMANTAADAASTMHGILHLVTDAMFEKLCQVEAHYDVITVPVQPYTTSAAGAPSFMLPVDAKAFIVHPDKLHIISAVNSSTPELPSQRYITIITAGLKHYGADPTWVRHIEAQPCTPRRQPEDYRKLPVAAGAEGLPVWSLAQLEGYKGQRPVVYAIGRKVLQVDTSAAPGHPMVTILENMMAGTQAAYGMCLNLYDPALPEITSPADMTDAHYAWAEDMAADMGDKHGFVVKHIAWLDLGDSSSSNGSNGSSNTTAGGANGSV